MSVRDKGERLWVSFSLRSISLLKFKSAFFAFYSSIKVNLAESATPFKIYFEIHSDVSEINKVIIKYKCFRVFSF